MSADRQEASRPVAFVATDGLDGALASANGAMRDDVPDPVAPRVTVTTSSPRGAGCPTGQASPTTVRAPA